MHNHSHTHISYQDAGNLIKSASSLSLAVGVVLVAIKAVAWSMTDSLSIMSSLADSMLDVMASGINFIAIRYALQPADHEHRFGHGKAEDLATLAQSTFICGSGVFLLIEGIKRIFSPEPVYNSNVGIGVMIISIIMTFSLILYQRFVVRKTESGAIHADATHYFVDFLTNIGVILALILHSFFGLKIADPIIALAIAFYIIYSAVLIGKTVLNNLMDREFSDEERTQIKQVVAKFSAVSGLHELRTRKSGINRFIQFHLDFIDENISLKQAHDISDEIEDALKAIFPHTEVLIHQDPVHGDRY